MTKPQRVLVVEDDSLVSEIIAAALEDSYPTTVVETAAQAMGQLKAGGYHLMLLDCTLPGGVDVDLIPEADKLGTAVILMSGDPTRIAKLASQSRPFVLKPFSIDGLLETVKSVLEAATPAAED